MPYKNYANEILKIAKNAGDIILEIYNSNIDVQYKDDNSPVTDADIAANEYIVKSLKKLTPEINIVTEEESTHIDNKLLEDKLFWLIDPLDGTKSFIKKTGEFTVNIALINNKIPVGGVVYVPVKDITYFVDEDGKAYKKEGDNNKANINVRKIPKAGAIVVASLSHRTQETDDFINNIEKVDKIIPAASSLKFCLVAEGKADIYPRFGRTMEWDTGAGHAVLSAAGGKVINPDGSDFTYCKDDFANGYFIAKS